MPFARSIPLWTFHMTCMTPSAPALLFAFGLKWLSAFAMPTARFDGTPYLML